MAYMRDFSPDDSGFGLAPRRRFQPILRYSSEEIGSPFPHRVDNRFKALAALGD